MGAEPPAPELTGAPDRPTAGRGALLSIVSGSLNIGANIVLFPLVVSSVGAGQYGIWLVMVAVAMIFFYSDLGIGLAIIFYSAQARGGGRTYTLDELMSVGMAWVCAIVLLVVPVYSWITYQYADAHAGGAGMSHGQVWSLIIIGALVMLTILLRPYQAVLIGGGYMSRDRVHQIIGTGARAVLIVVFCINHTGIVSIAAAEGIGIGTAPLLAAVFVRWRRLARVRLSLISFRRLQGVFSYSLRAFAVDIVTIGTLYAGTIVAGLVLSPSSAAYFSLAGRVYTGVGQLVTWMTAPVVPAFTQAFQRDRDSSRLLVLDLLRVVPAFAVLSVVTIALSAGLWVPLWVDHAGLASGATPCIVIMLVGVLSTALSIPGGLACDAAERPGVLFATRAGTAVIFLALTVPFTHLWGITGTAISFAIGLWVVQPWALAIVARVLELRLRTQILPALDTAGAMLLVGGVLAAIVLALAPVVGTGIERLCWAAFAAGALAVMRLPVGRAAARSARRLVTLPM